MESLSHFVFFYLARNILKNRFNRGMVSIKDGTILHGSDLARLIGHGAIVHENNRAPYRLDTARFSTGSIVHESVLQKRFGTGSIVHESVMQKRFGTGSIVHESVMQKRFGTSLIVHRNNYAPVNIKFFLYRNRNRNCAPVNINFLFIFTGAQL